MFDRLDLIEETYNNIQEKLMVGIADIKQMTALLKEAKKLEPTIKTYHQYKDTVLQIEGLKEMLELEEDSVMVEALKEELAILEERLPKLYEELTILLLPKDPDDDKNVIVEIKGAAGGDEANIFAGDLFRMYVKYADAKGWKIEVLNMLEGAHGGFTNIEFIVTGENVYSTLKYESGVHRVQRVPATESMGRVHTSTAVVLVMPEAEEVEIDISWNDIRFDTFNSSGPGGQSVNTTKSAVRLTHIPTGVAVSCQEGKSQHENKDKAFKLLKARIYDQIQSEKMSKEGQARKEMAGRGDRAEKIRTYNFPQNRVSDHRIGLTLQRLDAVIEGKVDLILEPLINEFQKRQLKGEG